VHRCSLFSVIIPYYLLDTDAPFAAVIAFYDHLVQSFAEFSRCNARNVVSISRKPDVVSYLSLFFSLSLLSFSYLTRNWHGRYVSVIVIFDALPQRLDIQQGESGKEGEKTSRKH